MRLTAAFLSELGLARVWHPELDRPQTGTPQGIAVFLNTCVDVCHGVCGLAGFVTCNILDGMSLPRNRWMSLQPGAVSTKLKRQSVKSS